jgi:hypothetical protein
LKPQHHVQSSPSTLDAGLYGRESPDRSREHDMPLVSFSAIAIAEVVGAEKEIRPLIVVSCCLAVP